MSLVLKNLQVIVFVIITSSLLISEETKASKPLTITIDEGSVRALSMGIVPLKNNRVNVIFDIVARNLDLTGRFDIFSKTNMISAPSRFEEVNFKNWRIFGVENLLVGSLVNLGPNLELIVELIDVLRQSTVIKKKFKLGMTDERSVAHTISNTIYKELIGRSGFFHSKLAYVKVYGDDSRTYSLIVSDFDGYKSREILKSDYPILSVAWSPNAKKLAYVSFESGQSEIYVQDLKTGFRKKIIFGDGIVGAPVFSSDSRTLIFTASLLRNIDLYKYDLATKYITRLTALKSIETEASISPSDKTIMFTSNQSGGTQIFQMDNKPLSAPRRITFGLSKFNANPVHSPVGNKFSYVTKLSNSYQIVVSDIEQRQRRVISKGKFDESPSFSPNGDMIVYSSKKGVYSELIISSVDGLKSEFHIALPDNALIEPSWGPGMD